MIDEREVSKLVELGFVFEQSDFDNLFWRLIFNRNSFEIALSWSIPESSCQISLKRENDEICAICFEGLDSIEVIEQKITIKSKYVECESIVELIVSEKPSIKFDSIRTT